jgi:hypothetical protein
MVLVPSLLAGHRPAGREKLTLLPLAGPRPS